jgi:hypothetical protein
MVCRNCGSEANGQGVCPICEGAIFVPKVEKPVEDVKHSHKKKEKKPQDG